MAPIAAMESISIASVMQYLYPSLALAAFLATRSVALYPGPDGAQPELYRTVRRQILLGLVAIIVGTFLATSINMLIRSIQDLPSGVDEYKSLYVVYAAVQWTFQVLFWPFNKDFVLFPYVVSSMICAVGEIVILEHTLSHVDDFQFFDTLSLNIQGIRVAAFLAIPCIYLGQIVSDADSAVSEDLERQPLLSEVARSSASPFTQRAVDDIRPMKVPEPSEPTSRHCLSNDGPASADEEVEPSQEASVKAEELPQRPVVSEDEVLTKVTEVEAGTLEPVEPTLIGAIQHVPKIVLSTPIKKGHVAEKLNQLMPPAKDTAAEKSLSGTQSSIRAGSKAIGTASTLASATAVGKPSAATTALRKISEPKKPAASPVKSITGKDGKVPKLKADVPEFVPRYMRTSTDTSNEVCPGTPPSITASQSSSPSRLRAHAPEFISQHARTSTDMSSSSVPKQQEFKKPYPLSPQKHHRESIRPSSPSIARSPISKPPLDRLANFSTSGGDGSDSSCPRFRDGRQSPAPLGVTIGNAGKSPQEQPPLRSRSRVHRRNMSKSEPASQMGSTVDGGHDSENSLMMDSPVHMKPIVNLPKPMGNRRVTAPSDPPAGEQQQKPKKGGNNFIGNGSGRGGRRSRHWRLRDKNGSKASVLSSRGSSFDSSADTGSVPRPPNGSPTIGPVPGYAYTGMS